MTHAHPLNDPLIDEVRQRRRDLYRSLDNDLKKLLEALRKVQSETPELTVDWRRERRAPEIGTR